MYEQHNNGMIIGKSEYFLSIAIIFKCVGKREMEKERHCRKSVVLKEMNAQQKLSKREEE